jgi:hypothetical protein
VNRGMPQRIALSAGVGLFVGLIAAVIAGRTVAATYTTETRRGEPAACRGWHERDRGRLADASTDRCSSGGDCPVWLDRQMSCPNGPPAGRHGWSFTAPAITTIASFSLYRRAFSPTALMGPVRSVLTMFDLVFEFPRLAGRPDVDHPGGCEAVQFT